MKLLNKKASSKKLSQGELQQQVTLKDEEIQRLKDLLHQGMNNLPVNIIVDVLKFSVDIFPKKLQKELPRKRYPRVVPRFFLWLEEHNRFPDFSCGLKNTTSW
ncbi:unnamed protein product [Dovyalis caffra]|uniref:Uncharacterized protein n=1 Tax=Dovyalis caffra TaxID=77055 RepID=A0AAV1RJV3_9ROSI|nr:unnamed protein product [Dovyalis caffra]